MMKKVLKLFGIILMAFVLSICGMVLFACGDKDDGKDKGEGGNESGIKTSDVFINTPITADAAYVKDCDQKGTITKLDYNAEAYAIEDAYGLDAESVYVDKTLYVYLPYGYSAENKYDVIYLQHGARENEGYWFAQGESYSALKDDIVKYGKIGNKVQNILDNLIKDGTMEPTILVSGTYYSSHISDYGYGTEEYPMTNYDQKFNTNFYKELKNDILPLIQQTYSTYAESATADGFEAARDHFGYIGFSKGSMTGFQSVWLNCLDYFSYIGNLSAGATNENANQGNQSEIVTEIIQKVTTGEYKDLKINYWYNGCGEWDQLIVGHTSTYNALVQGLGDKFKEGDDISKGENCWFNTHVEGGHEFWCWEADLYNCLQVFFKA